MSGKILLVEGEHSIAEPVIYNLKQEGFPPSFIFIYDEIWYNIIINMFDIYALLLDDENVYMESD